MMEETPKTGLDLARIAFLPEGLDGVVSLYHGLDDPLPRSAYEARRILRTHPADALEQIAALEARRKEADAAWQAAESRIVHICQILGVDYTCEEPETCEQVIEGLKREVQNLREHARHEGET